MKLFQKLNLEHLFYYFKSKYLLASKRIYTETITNLVFIAKQQLVEDLFHAIVDYSSKSMTKWNACQTSSPVASSWNV